MSAIRQSDGPPPGQPSRARVVDALFPSKLLPALVGLAQSVSALSPVLDGYVRFHLVLDANIIQGELRWCLGKRKKPQAQTRLHEAIVSGALVAYVPAIVEQEILEHAEDIALATRSSVADVHREWKSFRSLLRVHETLAEPIKVTEVVDRDDIPYIGTRSQLGLRAVYTNDRHLDRMGSPVVKEQIDLFLRDYARASAVKIGITLGSTTAFALSIETVPLLYRLLYRLLTSGISWMRRQSAGMQLAIVGVALALAIHPKSRAKFSQAWRAIAPTIGGAVRSTIVQLLYDYAEAMEMAESNRLKLELAVPPQKRRTALMHVRAVCLVKNRPMTLQQISTAMRADGYTSDAPHADAYLKRILRNAKEFSEVRPGVWILEDKLVR
jgi:hypothetical protein